MRRLPFPSLGAGLAVLVFACCVPASAKLPLEKVSEFTVRLKLTGEGDKPAAYTISHANESVRAADGEWSPWLTFNRGEIKAVLGRYPNSYSSTWPARFGLAVEPVKGIVHVELESMAAGMGETGSADLTGGLLGLAFWREKDENETAHVTTLGSYNRRKYWSVIDKLTLTGRLPTKIILQDRLIIRGDNDRTAVAEGLAGLRKMGFNCLLTDGNSVLGELGRKAGFTMFKGAIYNPPGYAFDLGRGKASATDVRDWARGLMDRFKGGGYTASEVAMYTISDEPGFYYPAMYRAVNDNPIYLERFHEFLRSQDLTPADLDAEDWAKVKMIGRSRMDGSLPVRRLYYWSQRFIPRQSAEHFAQATHAIEEAFYDGIPVVVNWNFFAARAYVPGPYAHNSDKSSPDAAMASHDWFDFGRLRGSNSLWTEDWFGDEWAYQWSFYSDKLRSSSAGGQFGALVIPRAAGAMSDGIMYKIMSLIGHGSKHLSFFVFGPEYNFPGNCYSQNPRVFSGLARTARLIGEAEELLYPGRPVKPQVAMLHHRSAEMWDRPPKDDPTAIHDATNTNLNAHCAEYTAELYDLYLALMHEQIPVEFISEDDAEWGALDELKVIYVVEPNVPAPSQIRLAEWVRRGGVLVTTSQAANYDRYNEPSHVLDEVRGLREAGRDRVIIPHLGAIRKVGRITTDLAHTQAGPMDVYGVKGKTTIPKGAAGKTRTIAAFEDGSPAVTTHRYGKGMAVHFAFLPGLSYRKSAKEDRGKFAHSFSKTARWWINWPLKEAGVMKPVELSRPLVEAPVLISEHGVAVTLLNWTNEPIGELDLELSTERPIGSVRTIKQGPVRWQHRNGVLQISTPLDTVDVVMIKYK